MMKAIRFDKTSPSGEPYSPANPPPPPSALHCQSDIPKPHISKPGELLVQVQATSVIRDNLSWPELFVPENPAQLGNDFAGIAAEVHPDEKDFKAGDHVYGMAHANRGGTWAEFVLVTSDDLSLKPKSLSWDEAAALPLSALTADQALFENAGLAHTTQADDDDDDAQGKKHVLITGAAGGVGTYLVQFAAAAGHDVVAATSSPERDERFLSSLGAREVAAYVDLRLPEYKSTFGVVIDTKGGGTLEACWQLVKSEGVLISVDSSSWDFVQKHIAQRPTGWRDSVKALFFIVGPSSTSMERISKAVQRDGSGGLQIFVSRTMPWWDADKAYALCQSGGTGTGKIVLAMYRTIGLVD